MRRVLPLAFILLTWLPSESQAVTAKEILELSRAGLSEEVLLALIEVDGGVFTLDTATLKSLKEGGVSERVILAMVRSGRTPQTESAPPVMTEQAVDPAPYVAPQPQVIVIEHERPVVEQVAVPVYVAVPQGHFISRGRRLQQHVPQPFDPSPGFGAPLPPRQHTAPVKHEPVYWGWGGKLRPDAWKPPNYVEKPEPKPQPPRDKK